MKNKTRIDFWQELKKAALGRPILALAPMAGITDSAFRQVCKSFGADVVYSEMASAAALCYNPIKTLEMLASDKKEAPYVVQLFGSKPGHFATAVKLLTDKKRYQQSNVNCQMSIAGLDINFGCPVKKVAKQGAGAVLMDRPKAAREIVKIVLGSTDLPVSVKIRSSVKQKQPPGGCLGSGQMNALKFLDQLSDLPLAAVMIHGRSMSQGHTGSVDFLTIKKARQHFGGVILANGGVVDKKTALDLLESTGADGLGIARGALGRPWIFDNIKNKKEKIKNREEIFEIALGHAELVYKLKGEMGIIEMRKHLCWYVAGQPDASELKRRLVLANNLKEIKEILK